MKNTLLLVSLAAAASLSAQTPDTTGRPILVASGGFFALSVADLDASTRWYTEKLGLRVIMRVPPQNRAAVAVLQGGGLTVELVQHDDARPVAVAAPGSRGSLFIHGLFKAGVTIEDFDLTLTRLRARGVEFAAGPFPARPDQPANVIIRDNAGNLIQLFGK